MGPFAGPYCECSTGDKDHNTTEEGRSRIASSSKLQVGQKQGSYSQAQALRLLWTVGGNQECVQSKLVSTIRLVRPTISLYQRYRCIQYLYIKYTKIQNQVMILYIYQADEEIEQLVTLKKVVINVCLVLQFRRPRIQRLCLIRLVIKSLLLSSCCSSYK